MLDDITLPPYTDPFQRIALLLQELHDRETIVRMRQDRQQTVLVIPVTQDMLYNRDEPYIGDSASEVHDVR